MVTTRAPILSNGRVEQSAFIGAGSIVSAGVTIGKGSVVIMGSTVHQNVQAGTFVQGNPASKISWDNVPAEQLCEQGPNY